MATTSITKQFAIKPESVKFRKIVILSVCLATYLTGFISYYLFMQTGYGTPDAVIEGINYYNDPNWHLSLGRWGVRYVNFLIGHNLVLPHLIIFLYCFAIIVTVMIIRYLFDIKNNLVVMLCSCIMTANTCVISQLGYRHVALTFALALVLSVTFVLLVSRNKWYFDVIGIICVAFYTGLYQSYISVTAVLTLMYAIIRLIDGQKVKDQLLYLLRSIICGGVGCLLYFVILKLEMRIYDTEGAARFNAVSVKDIFNGIGERIVYCYKFFFLYYNDIKLNRYILYRLFFIITIIAGIIILVRLIREHKVSQAVGIAMMTILIPIADYLIVLFIPSAKMATCMEYQYILTIPFSFAIIEKIVHKSGRFALYAVQILAFIILSTYIINANATFKSYQLSYESVKTQFQLILGDVYDLEGFEPNVTPILTIGDVSDRGARTTNAEIYQLAIDFPDNVYSWGGYQGVKTARYNFLTGYMGIDPKYNADDNMLEDYTAIINSEEFSEMPIWPVAGSAKMINGIAVVKLTEDPPIE